MVHNNPEAVPKVVTRMPPWITRQRESLFELAFPQGPWEPKKNLKLEKTRSNILSVLLLIYVFTLQFTLEEKIFILLIWQPWTDPSISDWNILLESCYIMSRDYTILGLQKRRGRSKFIVLREDTLAQNLIW